MATSRPAAPGSSGTGRPSALSFPEVFATAFGKPTEPFDWQYALACANWPEILIAPTGSGKTAGVTLAWAYHRLREPASTPRRLVWCLPMRTLVEQTNGEIRGWLERLEAAEIDLDEQIPRAEDVHVLMGGVDRGAWFEAPERPSIVVGTQDMLLSRALMRGYASSRVVWPMEFGVLHEDTQWVFDEVQLMGSGRATSAQLEAFRRQELNKATLEGRPVGRPCRSLWISATLEPRWLETVDFSAPTKVIRVDPAGEGDSRLRDLASAPKHLRRSPCTPQSSNLKHQRAYLADLARAIVDAHRVGHMTLVIVNQVKRAQDIHGLVARVLAANKDTSPKLVLLHSRFRPQDRKREMDRVVGASTESDIIVIATQAVEAGVDISATVMFTELAPWPSMVQRFGRANRWAEVADGANVFWIDLLGALKGDGAKAEKQATALSRPYEADELREARDRLAARTDVAPCHLPPPEDIDPPLRVLRRRDLDDLFDTDADLTGFDVDISPYIRDADDTDVRVFWRELPDTGDTPPKPVADELCAVPIGLAKEWIKLARERNKKKGVRGPLFYMRDPQWRATEGDRGPIPPGWVPLREDPWPGLTLLVDVRAGGYLTDLGFTGNPRHVPEVVDSAEPSSQYTAEAPESGTLAGQEAEYHDADPQSATGRKVHLSAHLRHVEHEAALLCDALGLDGAERDIVVRAARWHDLGKAHEVFQETMRQGLNSQSVPADALLAKSVKRVRHKRAYFRHELASALAFLAHERWSRDADSVAYLIAAHHGKVRMNLRSLPRESPPREPERAGARFARGVWEGDELPALDLGAGERWAGGSLTLSVMELGWDSTTRASWTERTRELLSRYGPFRLAWLETVVRLADWRASGKEASGGYDGA